MRNTLNPVFSEEDIQFYFKEINKIHEPSHLEEEVISAGLKELAIFKNEGGQERDWGMSEQIREIIFKEKAKNVYFSECMEYVDKMIEANIAVLNGKPIKEFKHLGYGPSKPNDFYFGDIFFFEDSIFDDFLTKRQEDVTLLEIIKRYKRDEMFGKIKSKVCGIKFKKIIYQNEFLQKTLQKYSYSTFRLLDNR